MSVTVEVCIDNIDSLSRAIAGGANRIELCASLVAGGLTASAGYMKQAAKLSNVPVYAIIRPRQGDFYFSDNDIEIMLADIHQAKQAGLQGVVIGALNQDATVNQSAVEEMMKTAGGMGVTFHRAIDQCSDLYNGLDFLMSQGVERVLTSGQAVNAVEGIPVLKKMVMYCGSRLSVMPGAGVSPENAAQIIRETGAREIHLSGKTTRASKMLAIAGQASMGNVDDFAIPSTCRGTIARTVAAVSEY
ncbi:copper homeostasis protein CutC [Parasalinivibrio latis]|uniref:copper homeostasis protein CutC n=1 Tax=Parasalinivibrio latis TaxID=2952610 RepID=UPI0030E1C255